MQGLYTFSYENHYTRTDKKDIQCRLKKNKTNARMKVVINKIKNQLIVCVVTYCQKNNLYSNPRSLGT